MPRDFIRKKIPGIEEDFLSEAAPFNYPIPELGFDLTGHQLSIYTEAWDAKMFRTRHHGVIIVNNTYLSSFAYNIAAVWMHYGHEYAQLKQGEDCVLVSLLNYNLKKFFAEQIMRRSNCIFGSAIFLETLFYEEHLMVPIIKAADNDESIRTFYHDIEGLMSSLLLFHEMGHLVREKHSNMLQLMQEEKNTMNKLGSYWGKYSEKQQIEFECDAFSVLLLISQMKDEALERGLRGVIFAFNVFAVMSGLDKSAEETAIKTPSKTEDLDDIFNDLTGADFSIGVDPFMVARATSVQLIVEALARKKGIDLYASSHDLLLYKDMMDVLSNFSLEIITRKNPPYRGKCEMLARALSGNPRGMRYLKLRSKKFVLPR